MKSRIGMKSQNCFFQMDQLQGKPSPKKALAAASKKRRCFASRFIWRPKTFEQAMLLITVRTKRFGEQSLSTGESWPSCSAFSAGDGEATDNASVSAIFATCLGSQKHRGGSGCGSDSQISRLARIRQAFFVSRQP